MSAAQPMVCTVCWPKKSNHNEPCEHVMELVNRIKAGEEDRARLTSLLADLQQENNDRAAREEKLRKALRKIKEDGPYLGTGGCVTVAAEALVPTDTKEPNNGR